MLGTLFKVLVVVLFVIAITAVVGLTIMAGVASTHDVKRIDIPKTTSIISLVETAAYADAYRVPMEFDSYRTIREVADNVSHKGQLEIHRNDHEVVYAGSAPGITYQIAYILDRDIHPPTLAMVTVVRTHSRTGRYCWKAFKPIHRCLAPYMLDRLAARAPD